MRVESPISNPKRWLDALARWSPRRLARANRGVASTPATADRRCGPCRPRLRALLKRLTLSDAHRDSLYMSAGSRTTDSQPRLRHRPVGTDARHALAVAVAADIERDSGRSGTRLRVDKQGRLESRLPRCRVPDPCGDAQGQGDRRLSSVPTHPAKAANIGGSLVATDRGASVRTATSSMSPIR